MDRHAEAIRNQSRKHLWHTHESDMLTHQVGCVQEGLQGLKQEWVSQLHLKKAPAAASPDAPFPVSLALHPEPPDSCSLFDQLEGLTLRATIHKQFLEMSSGGAPAPLWQALSLGIESAQLPRCLCKAMSAELRSKVASSAPSFCAGAAVVRILLDVLRRSFLMLLSQLPEFLTVMPQLLESYESVGATGNSERRIKFTSPPNENEAALSEDSGAPVVTDTAAAVETPDTTVSWNEAPQLHPAIQKMIKLLAARFPDLRATADRACEAVGEREASSTEPGGLGVQEEVPFCVSITPSDASWLHGSVQCSGSVALLDSPSDPSGITSLALFKGSSNDPSSGTTMMSQKHSTPVAEEPSTSLPSGERKASGARAFRAPLVPSGRAAGQRMVATLAVEAGEIVDVPTCAIVNHMLSKEAERASGELKA